MYIVRGLRLLWLVPYSWLDARLVRKKPFATRYDHMSKHARKFMKVMHIKLVCEQEEKLPEGVPILFVSNHQCAFDMLMQMAAIQVPFTFISKQENAKVPYVSSWAKTLELIYFDREDRNSAIHMLREAARQLKSGRNLLIFPEGTRSKDGKLLELQAGSLQPAFMAKALIVPVVLKNSYDYKAMIKQGVFAQMKILTPLSFEEYKPLKAEGVAKLLQERMEQALYE